MTIRDTAWGAFLMGSEGWSVFAGHKMVVSHLAEDQAHSIVAEVAQLEERVRELETENEQVEERRIYWWRKACGRLRILTRVKERVMPPEEYYEWAEKYIDDEEANLQEALGVP